MSSSLNSMRWSACSTDSAEDQVEHIFATFHRGWNYASAARRGPEALPDWKGKA